MTDRPSIYIDKDANAKNEMFIGRAALSDESGRLVAELVRFADGKSACLSLHALGRPLHSVILNINAIDDHLYIVDRTKVLESMGISE